MTREKYESLPLATLKELAKARKMRGVSTLKKGDLIDAMLELDEQEEGMFLRLVKELAEKDGITETLKAENQMLWVQRMNAVREIAIEIINNDLIYA